MLDAGRTGLALLGLLAVPLTRLIDVVLVIGQRNANRGTPVSPDAPRLSHGRVEVRTEQLLLALIAHGEGFAAHVLSQFGVDLEKAAVATQSVRFPKPAHLFPDWEESEQWPPAPPKAN
jgi:Clp amino terminal domain, pathogenicity island component